MGAGDGSLVEFVGQSLLASEFERVAQTGIVGMHVQNARDDGLVGAVTAVSLGERAAQADAGLDRTVAEDFTGDAAQTARTRGV